jgi:hypothetical protein
MRFARTTGHFVGELVSTPHLITGAFAGDSAPPLAFVGVPAGENSYAPSLTQGQIQDRPKQVHLVPPLLGVSGM